MSAESKNTGENKAVPFYIYEAALARMERVNKRLAVGLVLTVLALLASWIGFFWYESQYEDVVVTQEATSDGSSKAVVAGVAIGDMHYGGDSETND